MEVRCQYCGKVAEFVDSSVVYGRSYGMIYLCRPCDAYVGVHKGTDKPLGILADAQLRKWKRIAHTNFDPIWRSGAMKRNQAYSWLSKQMGIPKNETHIGMFDIEKCKQVVDICRKKVKRE